jgi:hypothetical protein
MFLWRYYQSAVAQPASTKRQATVKHFVREGRMRRPRGGSYNASADAENRAVRN